MATLIEQLRLWVETIIVNLGYPGIALAMMLENLFPPIPSIIIMPFAGFLVSQGRFSFAGIVIAGTIGSLMSALILYYVGRWADELLIRQLVRRFGPSLGISEAKLDRVLHVFDRYGPAMVCFGRCISLVRSLISIPAGMRRMRLSVFLPLTAIGSGLWNALLGYAGMLLGQHWQTALGLIDQYDQFVALAVAALALLWLAHRVWHGRMRHRALAPMEKATTQEL